MENYNLTALAEEDVAELYSYGWQQWGETQAERYYEALKVHLDQVAADPMRHPPVEHVGTGMRRSVFRSHAIYFKVSDGIVTILAIQRSQNTTRIRG